MAGERRRDQGRLTLALAVVGVVGTLAALAALGIASEAALKAWLAATMIWSGLPIGALCLLMMMHLIVGVWDDELMVQVEGAVMLMPLAALAFVPLVFGIGELYHWVGRDQHTAFRELYLSEGFLIVRTFIGLGLLSALAALLILARGWSVPVSAAGLVLYPIVTGLLSVDWLMTLDAHFHSSVFGLYILSIQVCVALMCAAMVTMTDRNGVRQPGVVGGLMLASVLIWAYLAFMQYFIIWSGNLPPGVRWYEARAGWPWSQLFWAIAVLHAVPGFMLLLPPVLHRPRLLVGIAGSVLVGKALEMAWLVLPAGNGTAAVWPEAVLFAAAMLGLGGLFGAGLILAFRRRVAARAPRGSEAPT